MKLPPNLFEALKLLKEKRELDIYWKILAGEKVGDVFKELPIYYQTDSHLLSGIVDALIATHQSITIIDWKSSAFLASLKQSERLQQIRNQLLIYANSFKKFAGNKKLNILAIGIGLQASKSPKIDVIINEEVFPQKQLFEGIEKCTN